VFAWASRIRKRHTSTVVLPDPAGACSSTERCGSSASRRARSSAARALTDSLFIIVSLEQLLAAWRRADAACQRQVTAAANSRQRLHVGATIDKLRREPCDQLGPMRKQLRPAAFAGARRADARQ